MEVPLSVLQRQRHHVDKSRYDAFPWLSAFDAVAEFGINRANWNQKVSKMKFMDLDATYRKWLISNAALDFDKDLNEKFVGLTYEESIFFAEISRTALPPKGQNADELERFIELHERHECAIAFSVKHASILC
jgi:hypothetical protein